MIRVGSPEDHGLALDLIQTNGGTQSRAYVNDQVVNEYAEAIKAGATFPPIVVFYDGKKHWLADGFHRFHAYRKIGREKVAADVRQGTRRDAILHSVGANETHGLRRTRDDKRRAVLTLLNDAEWGKWTDREIARRCAVSPQTVANVRADTVQNGQSGERTYVHPKTGKPTTMKTAGINASRTQFQAKASEDNGSITGGAGAVTGEASRLASGRTDAGEAASVDLPTISDAERDADAIQSPFDRASDEGRALFLARNHLQEQPKVETHDAEACNTHSNAVDPASTVTDGRANSEQIDVDRSASRASSAVEVGAPVSTEGAQASLANGPCEAVSERTALVGPATGSAGAGVSGQPEMIPALTGQFPGTNVGGPEKAGVTAGETAPNSPSDDDAFSEVKGAARPESAAGVEPSSSDINPQEPTSSPATADKAGEVEPPPSASPVAISKPFVLRPHCLHPDLCAGSGANHCWSCRKAMAESEAA